MTGYGLLPAGASPDALVAAFQVLRKQPFVCAHIRRNRASIAFGCGQHPRLGLMCNACLRQHLPRHDQTEEQRCDRCRTVVDTIHPIIGRATAIALAVRRARGGGGLLFGEVIVIGTGLCRTCHDEATNSEKAS